MILPNHEIISFLQEVRRSFEFGKGALGIPFGPIWLSGTQNNQSVQVEISNSNWTVLIVLRQRQKQFSQYFAQYVIKHRQSMLELYTTLVHLYFQSHKLFRPEIQNQLFSHSIRVSFWFVIFKFLECLKWTITYITYPGRQPCFSKCCIWTIFILPNTNFQVKIGRPITCFSLYFSHIIDIPLVIINALGHFIK